MIASHRFCGVTLARGERRQSRGLLKHARQKQRAGIGGLAPWTTAIIDSSGFIEIAPAVVAGPGDTLRVAYADASEEKLAYAWTADSVWHFETIAAELPDVPGEMSLFATGDTLYAGYLSGQTLRLAMRVQPDTWEIENVAAQEVPYVAAFAADWLGRPNIVYRAQTGFQSEIRHLLLSENGWQEELVTRTGTQGSWLVLKRAEAYYSIPILVLAYQDGGFGKVVYYERGDWAPVGQSHRTMSDTRPDFIITDLFTLILFYRALPEKAVNAYDDNARPDLVSDIVIAVVNDVRQNETVQAGARKMAAFPNPFNAQTTLEYTLAEAGHVEIQIFDLLGRLVATLQNGRQQAGTYRFTFAPEQQSSGLYFCRYRINGSTGVLKLALVK